MPEMTEARRKQTFQVRRLVTFKIPSVPNFVRPVDGSAAVQVSELHACPYRTEKRIEADHFAALHARLVNQGWQPIETAPKGELVLVSTDGKCFDIALTNDGHLWWSNSEVTFCFPTHWQPLPPPPAPSEATQ